MGYFTWLASSTWGKSIYSKRAVMHYTAEVKPWNFLDWQSKQNTFFGQSYIADIWSEWIKLADGIMARHDMGDPRYPTGPRLDECADPKVIKHYTARKYKGKTKEFTVLLVAAMKDEARLSKAIEHYTTTKGVRAVIVAWLGRSKPDFQLPKENHGKKVTLYVSQ